MGIIGIVLGVISLILAFIPCVGVVAFLPAGLALVFSIISIVQASRDYGSKGLGIGALIISMVAILFAALWLAIFSGASIIANKAIQDPDNFERFGREFEKAFKEEMKKDYEMDAVSDSLEAALRELEDEMEKMHGTDDQEHAKKAAEAAAKTIKRTAKGLRERNDSSKR